MTKWAWLRRVGLAILIIGFPLLALRLKDLNDRARLSARAGKTFVAPAGPEATRAAMDTAVSYAREITGKFYDPLMGRFGDPFGKIGCVVCIDVPIRAYKAAGISMPGLLRKAASENPAWFSIGPQNAPGNTFFYRRVRNYHALFQHHPQLEADSQPHVGDWAFYGTVHIALVTEIAPDGKFRVIEASPIKGRVAVSDGDYMTKTWGAPDFFGRIKVSQ